MRFKLEDISKIISFCKEEYHVDIGIFSELGLYHRISLFFQAFDSFDHFFKKCENKSFFNQFIIGILPGGPEMFRDPFVWWDIRDNIVKKAHKKDDFINVWIPDILAGEELYSIIILLEELGVENYKIEVSELIPDTVKKHICKGMMRIANLEMNLSNYQRFGGRYVNIDYYCELLRGELVFNKKLLSKVKFINSDDTPDNPHLVLYSNKLINFTSSVKDKKLKVISENIDKRSYLVLGANDVNMDGDISKDYKVFNKENRIYIKK